MAYQDPILLILIGVLGIGITFLAVYAFLQHRTLKARNQWLMTMPAPVIVLDGHRRIVYINRMAERLLGIPNERAIGLAFNDAFPGGGNHLEIIDNEDQTPSEIQFEVAGQKYWYHIEVIPLVDQRNHPSGSVALLHEASRYKQLESALEASQEIYRSVTEQADDGIAIIKDDLIVYINPRLLAMTGFLPADMLHHHFEYFVPVEHVHYLQEGFRQRTQGQTKPFFYETTIKRKDRRPVQVELKISVMNFEGKEAALVMLRDITIRKRAEAQLHLQSQALQSAANGFVITDREGSIQWVNAAFTKMTGYKLEEVVGKNPRILQSGRHNKDYYQDLWRTIISGNVWRGELVNRKKNGELYDEHMTIAPVMDEAENITHFVAVKEDITERKRAEKALRRSEKQFRELVWNTPVPVMVFGNDDRIIFVNWRFKEMFGYDVEDIPTIEDWWTLAFQDEASLIQIRQEWHSQFQLGAQDSSGFFPIEAEVVSKHGEVRSVRFSLVKLDDKYIVAIIDRTKQKQAEYHLSQRARQSSLLNEITLSALKTNDLEILCQELADRLGELLEADGCFIALWDGANRRAVPMAAYGPMRDTYREAARPVDGEPTLTESVLQAGHVIAVQDVFNSPYTSKRIAANFPTRSMLGLPLIADGRKLGAALISFEKEHMFTPEEIERGEQAAAQIALAIAKVELFEAERVKHQLSLALVEISTLLSAGLNVETLLTRMLDLILRVVPYDVGNVFVIEEGRTRVLYTQGYDHFGKEVEEAVRGMKLDIASTPNLRQMVETQRPLIISDTTKAPGWIPILPEKLFRSWAGAPIHYDGEVRAIFDLHKQEPDFFQPEHAGRLAAFAGQAAIALENARLFDEVHQLAILDPVTGAFTRRYILELAVQEIERARRYTHPLCACIVDFDHFKRINDTYGHLVGDLVLQKVIQLFKEILRKTDKIGRFGGEEFLILLPETELVHAMHIAERMRSETEKMTLETKTDSVRVAISIGVSCFDHPTEESADESLKKLIDQADQALLTAKGTGRNRVVQYSSSP